MLIGSPPPATHQRANARAIRGTLDEICINTIRTLAMDAVQKAKSGHPGSPMGLAPAAYTLWQRYLRFDPDDPLWPNRDRFVLSVGHASMLLYALLHLTRVKAVNTDYEQPGEPAVTLEDIKRFRQLDSKCPGHPEYRLTSGVETTTGPLGQGCGNSVGMAIAGCWLGARYNRPGFELFDYDVYALAGDGDMMEGVSSEAASLAGHLRLSNLCWIYDSNRVSIEGHTELAFSDDVAARFMAYGWNVTRVGDANDTERIARALETFRRRTDDRPTLVIIESHIAYGAPHKQDTSAAHGEPLGEEEVRLAKKAYRWPEDAHFLVPDGVYEHFRSGVGERGGQLRKAWHDQLARYRAAHPDLAAEMERLQKGENPAGWDIDLPAFAADAKGLATRESSGKVLNAIARHHPWLVGGAADLAPSTKTRLEGTGEFEAHEYAGRNLHFGVREHAMGAVVNGLVLSGLRAYGSSFLIFSDYMKPPLRLSALMEVPAIWIFTHDSIGLGEDGPTHQPVEQLIGLRAIPGMIVLRPADANEAVEAWRVIIGLKHCPACLVLTRQAVPTLDRSRYAPAAGLARGAYVLADPADHSPQVILVGAGSDVHVCIQAHEQLAQQGIAARVVSMPSWELFEQQDEAYRESVLPSHIEARVCVEEASVIGWDRYAGASGAKIGMHTFGASAPLKDLLNKFGFTAGHVVAAAQEQIARKRTARPPNPLKQLAHYRQSIWLDFLSRRFIEDGHLARLVAENGLAGVTSNPSIFEKAIAHDREYDAALREIVQNEDSEAGAIYERLAIEDIREAADVLRPVYEATGAGDGYVSLEVSPYLAHETNATIEEARRLWREVDRKNLMIKVPATPQGLPAIRQLTAEGINVNITLLFSQNMYEQVAEAYLAGIEQFLSTGGKPHHIASVASFFVSRIDTAVDKLVDERLRDATDEAGRKALEGLKGTVAIANAKLAYQRYLRIFSGERWERLAAQGARKQRLLWGSTGTKNRAYSDVLYVDELIGPDTVNTLPPATMDAFRDHGKPRESLTQHIDDAQRVMDELAAAGISIDAVTSKLVEDGVRLFADAFDQLLAAVSRRRNEILGGVLDRQDLALPEYLQGEQTSELDAWRKNATLRRIWHHDAQVWTDTGEAKWLGWLRVVDAQQQAVESLEQFGTKVREAGFRHVLLLGMGGSSLGPEVLARTFGPQPDHPQLLVLDSTDPAQIKSFESHIDLARTLFVVSSKSGSTLEPNILHQYFFERVRSVAGDDAASRFVAITDPGSALQHVAERDRFRRVFPGEPSIGGRYSVLSNFGMVPAACIGLDLARLLGSAQTMVRSCAASVPPAENPAAQLGVALGLAAKAGRDKVTIVASPALASFGAWLEQLLAESTGKQRRGIIPVDAEPLGPPQAYGEDRFFVHLRLASEPDERNEHALSTLETLGHPVARIVLHDRYDLGQEFFRWEMATAVAGAILGINPFDQPDVETSKVKARELTAAYEQDGSLPSEVPVVEERGIKVYADKRKTQASSANAGSLAGMLKDHLDRLESGDYCALLAYVERNEAHARTLQDIRLLVRDSKRVATCVGFGPRFLHSTGQVYKGGPNSGVFVQITCDDATDIAVPGHRYSFGVVKAAQARGDFEVLAERGRPALRVHLGADVAAGLGVLKEAMRQALS